MNVKGVVSNGRQNSIKNISVKNDFGSNHNSLGQTEHIDRTIQSQVQSRDIDDRIELNKDLQISYPDDIQILSQTKFINLSNGQNNMPNPFTRVE